MKTITITVTIINKYLNNYYLEIKLEMVKIDKQRRRSNQSADIRNGVFNSYSSTAEVLRRSQKRFNQQLFVGRSVLLDLPADDLITLSILILFQQLTDVMKPQIHQSSHIPTVFGLDFSSGL